jgi:hypothetical protein
LRNRQEPALAEEPPELVGGDEEGDQVDEGEGPLEEKAGQPEVVDYPSA